MSNLNKFIQTNGASTTSGRSEKESWEQFMRSQTATGIGIELEKNWLRIKGGKGETTGELWGSYLNSKGFTQSDLGDRKRAFFEGGTQT